MKKNLNGIDRILRLMLAALIVVLYYLNIVSGTLGIVLIILAGIFALTSFISFCPIYAVFGFSTCAVKEKTK